MLISLLSGLLMATPVVLAFAFDDPNISVQQLVAGLDHTCVVAQGTHMRCWGNGDHGKLGYGSSGHIGDDELPYEVGDIDLHGFGPISQAVAHDGHTCALNSRGQVRCWGYGPVLGTMSVGGGKPPSSTPNLDLGRPAVQLAANALRTCALLDTGRLRCWGDNSGGELGYGHTESIGDDEAPSVAGPVPLGTTARAVYGGGDHFCVVTLKNNVRCWGQNNNGQLGYGHTNAIGDDETPASAGDVDLDGDAVVQVAVGGAHTCALIADGSLRCWGLNQYGQLGYGHTSDVGDNEPGGDAGYVEVDATRKVTAIAAGAVHTCALLQGGAVKCWGYGFKGQLGYGDHESLGDDELPLDLPDIELGGPAVQLSMGTHTCALLTTRRVRCWGLNDFGQLGYGDTNTVGLDNVPADAGDVIAF